MVREGLGEYPYLLMPINICPGDCNNQLEIMNMSIDEDNWKSVVMVKRRSRKVRRFSSNEFWRNIGCLILAPTFGLGGKILWKK